MDGELFYIFLGLSISPYELRYSTGSNLNTYSALIQNFYSQETAPHQAIHLQLNTGTEEGQAAGVKTYVRCVAPILHGESGLMNLLYSAPQSAFPPSLKIASFSLFLVSCSSRRLSRADVSLDHIHRERWDLLTVSQSTSYFRVRRAMPMSFPRQISIS